ncbi:hypothetical protein HPB47_015457, partial [Ixodes persulcatus]
QKHFNAITVGVEKDVRHTDAAMYPDRSMAAASVTGKDKDTLTTATLRTRTPL